MVAMIVVATEVYASPRLGGLMRLEVTPAGGRSPGSSLPTDDGKPPDSNEDILMSSDTYHQVDSSKWQRNRCKDLCRDSHTVYDGGDRLLVYSRKSLMQM